MVLIPPQTFAFVVCAAASGRMFWHWKRLDAAARDSVWKHYGWFCGLMCSGCCVGAISYLAWSQFLAAWHNADYDQVSIRSGSVQYFEAVASYAIVSAVLI
jgi:hypothetical protein